MVRLLTFLLVLFVIIVGFGEARQQTDFRGAYNVLTPQLMETLQAERFERAGDLIEEARVRAGITAERTPLSAEQILSFHCRTDYCACHFASDCLDLGQSGLCKPGTIQCNAEDSSCECERQVPTR